MEEITIYTDGACSGNPGPGGWGAVLMYGEHYKEITGAETDTTNQRMEVMAVIEALKAIKGSGWKVRVHSDSAYFVNAIQKGWLKNWQRNGWKNSKKEDVANQDLWKELIPLLRKHQVRVEKVKGHSGDKWNERCDQLAREAIQGLEEAYLRER